MSILGDIMSKILGHPAVGTTSTSATPPPPAVDVEAVLTDLATKSSETLDWKTSIVDLLKLLGLDSSFAAREELAHELGYAGSPANTAAMNMWLHKEVMTKLAENGGKVPDELKAR